MRFQIKTIPIWTAAPKETRMEVRRDKMCFRRLFRDQRGATAVEYGLIMALICLAVLSGVNALGASVKDRWDDIATKVGAA